MIDIEIGTGATEYVGSDRYPYTVIAVDQAKKLIVVQSDNCRRMDKNGMSEIQEYQYARNHEGRIYILKQYKDHSWRSAPKSTPFSFGVRQCYYDFSR